MHKASFLVAGLSLLIIGWAGYAVLAGRRSVPDRDPGVVRPSATARTHAPRPTAGHGPRHRPREVSREPLIGTPGDDTGPRDEEPSLHGPSPDGSDLTTREPVRPTPDPGPSPDAVTEEVEIPDEPPPETVEVAPGHWVLSAADEERVRRDHQRILETQIRFATRFNRNLGRRELCLDEVVSNGELARFGFRSGDVLVSVDGRPMESSSQVARYFQEHPQRRSFLVTIRRLGKLVRKRFTAP